MDSQVALFSSVQSLSRVWLFVTPWTAACQATLSITNSQSLLKHMSIESVMPSNHLILCRPLLLLPLIFPSIRVFSNESVLDIRWPKYWSFSFSISPSRWFSGKEFACQCRQMWVWSLPQEGSPREENGNPLQYSCLDNPMDRGAWRAAVTKSSQSVRTQLRDWACMLGNKSAGSINETEYSYFLVWIKLRCLFLHMFIFLLNSFIWNNH